MTNIEAIDALMYIESVDLTEDDYNAIGIAIKALEENEKLKAERDSIIKLSENYCNEIIENRYKYNELKAELEKVKNACQELWGEVEDKEKEIECFKKRKLK